MTENGLFGDEDLGRRDRKSDRRRMIAGILLLLCVLALEFSLGSRLQKDYLAGLEESQAGYWEVRRYLDPSGSVPATPKPEGVKRILYLSNSHALTGGKVARHLQALLDQVSPGGFEVLDFSTGGVFAPEILERLASGLGCQPDAVILAPSYISFSDRMKLARQRISARSFFNATVFTRLPAGFFLRNWDINLFADTLAGRFINLVRHRNAFRDLWEGPLAGAIREASEKKRLLFLEVDEEQNWRFPEGFDRNLFDWMLYSLGRKNHLKDMEAAVRLAKDADLPLLALNMPVDWGKEPHERSVPDAARYRESLRKVFSDADLYVDYEDSFPKEFSTYDALHPNWFGARLHALDIAFRLRQMGVLDPETSPESIAGLFSGSDAGVSEDYKKELDGKYPPFTSSPGMRRYDIFEPENARDLMRRMASMGPAHREVQKMLIQTSLRARYWEEMPFAFSEADFKNYEPAFCPALGLEIQRARERAAFFCSAVSDFQQGRLAACPVPPIGDNKPEKTEQASVLNTPVEIRVFTSTQKIGIYQYMLPGRERTIAFDLIPPNGGTGCRRVDIFGDGSFSMGCLGNDPFVMPPWASGIPLRLPWGV